LPRTPSKEMNRVIQRNPAEGTVFIEAPTPAFPHCVFVIDAVDEDAVINPAFFWTPLKPAKPNALPGIIRERHTAMLLSHFLMNVVGKGIPVSYLDRNPWNLRRSNLHLGRYAPTPEDIFRAKEIFKTIAEKFKG